MVQVMLLLVSKQRHSQLMNSTVVCGYSNHPLLSHAGCPATDPNQVIVAQQPIQTWLVVFVGF